MNLIELGERREWYRLKWIAQFSFAGATDKKGFEGLQSILKEKMYWEKRKVAKPMTGLNKDDLEYFNSFFKK